MSLLFMGLGSMETEGMSEEKNLHLKSRQGWFGVFIPHSIWGSD